jgi:phage shock protein C
MKRLYKSRKHKVLDGVCGGIAEYFEVDPVLIRIIAVVLLIATLPAAFIAYIVGMIIIPYPPLEDFNKESKGPIEMPPSSEGQSSYATTPFVTGKSSANNGKLIFGIILIVLGFIILMSNIPFFGESLWSWLWHMGWRYFWPSVLIVIGLLILLSRTRK